MSEQDFALAMTAAVEASHAVGGGRTFTEFELLTAAALWLMRERGVEVACLEVGMGGRWDSTSVVDPAVAVVTGVGLDHTERLGSTVEAIAEDKSRIIKPGASVVLGPGTAKVVTIFLDRAAEFGSHPLFVAEDGSASPVNDALTVRYTLRRRPDRPGGAIELDVRGIHAEYADLVLTAPAYQAPNVAVAVAATECALGRAPDADASRRALAAMTFPGRFELLVADPPLVIDGAHNPQAAGVLAEAVLDAWPDDRSRPLCVLGVLTDKDADGIVRALAPAVDGFVVTQPDSISGARCRRLGGRRRARDRFLARDPPRPRGCDRARARARGGAGTRCHRQSIHCGASSDARRRGSVKPLKRPGAVFDNSSGWTTAQVRRYTTGPGLFVRSPGQRGRMT